MSALENVMVATPGLTAKNPLYILTAREKIRRWEREAREQAMFHLSLVGMADRANSSADKLSLGQMKRVAIARLLQSRAVLLLLDEPLAGLDMESAESLLSIFEELRTLNGKTMLIVEHRHEYISGLCDEIWYLDSGRLNNMGNFA
jgi:branched-chain amino acid transport system permease protein